MIPSPKINDSRKEKKKELRDTGIGTHSKLPNN